MQFNARVTFLTNKAPFGWRQDLTLAQYAALDDESKHYYGPVYAKYRTVKRRSYDYDTGAFCGWEPYEVGVGDPISYTYIGYIAAKVVKSVLASNIIATRLLARQKT